MLCAVQSSLCNEKSLLPGATLKYSSRLPQRTTSTRLTGRSGIRDHVSPTGKARDATRTGSNENRCGFENRLEYGLLILHGIVARRVSL